ncbi:MAG TPA: M20/M25/M40 family metallo-hydrolase, partial [Blastocatellia bacterium]|nr:M20/M25/M40 family metallo-hydrolase [Blastocatellia bacterium]
MSSKSREARTESSSPFVAMFVAAAIAIFAVVSLYTAAPPAPLPANAPASEFSAERAIAHVRAIAGAPHPLWSPGDASAREYIVAQLRAMGLDPQVQEATSVIRGRGFCSAGVVKNVVARMSGTANTRAVMLVAHYDSVPTGPGASDDGSGVATLLETLRALKASPSLRNDVIFLFSDGEEEGLYGARAFVRDNPWVKDVGVALNFEARGAGGTSFMFETSNDNGWLIRQFAAAAPYPSANSLTYALYKLLPNDTDMTEFKKAGMAGLNFAYIGDWNRYHTMLDTVQNLDARSLQQDGSYALAMAGKFGNLDLRQTKEPDAAYFNTLGRFMVYYPLRWTLPIALIVLANFIVMLVVGFKTGTLAFRGIGLGLLASLISMVAAREIGAIAWWTLQRIHPYYSRMPWGDPYNGGIYLLALAALTVLVTALIYGWCAKRATIGSLAAGAATWWMAAV